MKAINLSPSFLSKLYDKGYDYAVGEKLGLIKKENQTQSFETNYLIEEIQQNKILS